MSRPVKVSYLVAAHRDPEQCRRLLGALTHERASVFVHVDSRVAARDFIVEHSAVRFLRDRIPVNRGGWSLARAIVGLLREAHETSDSDYFIYLAGTDYPIKSGDEIVAHLTANQPWNFLNYYPLLAGTSGYANLRRYHFVDPLIRLSGLLRPDTQEPVDRREPFPGLTRWLNTALPPRRFPAEFVPFRGSSRWCLNRATVAYILEMWGSPATRRLRRYLRYSWGSDEILFQTLVFNSALASQCRLYDPAAVREIIAGRRPPWDDEIRSFLHYIDWDPAREDPALLDTRDFERLRDSKALFACKFTTARSSELLDLVDSRLRRPSP
jgi:hypothetical protein